MVTMTADDRFIVQTRINNNECDTSRIYISLTNNSGTDIRDFVLCFTIVRELISETFKGGMLLKNEGSYHEVAPLGLKDGVLSSGETWEFSSENTRLAMEHITDGAVGCFVKISDGKQYLIAGDASVQFIDKNVVIEEVQPPQNPPKENFVPIVPAPNGVEFGVSDACLLYKGFQVTADTAFDTVFDAALDLGMSLWKSYNPIIRSSNGTPLSIKQSSDFSDEGYKLDITETGVEISASTTDGAFYGMMSLMQMCHGYTVGKTVTITDTPTFEYRGQHLDVVRQFYTVTEVKRIIDICAFHKINVLHWHLTDDEAWRLELKSIPELTERLAYRGTEEFVPPCFGSDFRSYGGFYTQEQVTDIIDYAKRRGIDVIPEIDVPGHCFGLLNAFPELVEDNDQSQYTSVQNYSRNTLNPALPATYDFLEKVIAEVATIFPSKYLHIGSDERPSGAWLGVRKMSHFDGKRGSV